MVVYSSYICVYSKLERLVDIENKILAEVLLPNV